MFTQIRRFIVLSSCLCFGLALADQELDRLAEDVYKNSKMYEAMEATIEKTLQGGSVHVLFSNKEREQYKQEVLSDAFLKTPFISALKKHFTKEELRGESFLAIKHGSIHS